MHDRRAVRKLFNPEMLQLAREARGLTQTSLAVETCVSQSRISKFEDGVAIPPDSELAAIAKALDTQVDFFFRPGPARSPTVSFFRKTASIPLKTVSTIEARINVRRLQIEEMIDGVSMEMRIPHLHPATPADAVVIARRMRAEWNVPVGPVCKLMRLVEQLGCIVEYFDFACDKLDGISIWTTTGRPLVFLNANAPADRIRLTLSHELGHLVMHREPSDTVEDEAWDFAAEFLMPAAEISRCLHPLTLQKLGELKVHWGVSMQALLKRGQKLHKVNERYARYLWMQLGKAGYRVREPYEQMIEREEPLSLRLLNAMRN